MTKWMTNNIIVLESVPEKDRAKNINEIDLSEESTVERARRLKAYSTYLL
jgi:hypothetical protein